MNSDEDDDITRPETFPQSCPRPDCFCPFDKDPDDDIPFHGFEEDAED
jgi:hypothetical protein